MSGDDAISRRGVLLAGGGGAAAFGLYSWPVDAQGPRPGPRDLRLPRIPGARPRNILLVLTDDHRYDAMGFMRKQSFGDTPTLDRLAAEGAHFRNAFVTTALCSPSRATVLTGLYAHKHRVVDNEHAVDPNLVFFPAHLQAAGYDTAFIGKWHMGGQSDAPQPGFHRWVSFKGHGSYMPSPDGLNVDGRQVPQRGYITDELTEYALEWLEARPKDKPWMMYLSHKAVHHPFEPAARHKGRYARTTFRPPASMAADGPAARGRPRWVKDQRNSWHGVDFPFHTREDVGEIYKRYMETLLAVDEGLGRVMDLLEKRGELDDTLIVYMGDNGFMWGEHGLIDKRAAYEESMRVPLLARCPAMFKGGAKVDRIVANIDIAPSLLAAAGLRAPAHMSGADFLPLAAGRNVPWRDELLYEYYWERNFPYTPTTHALRNDRHKFVRYHGVWDLDELYDLQADPGETDNLMARPGHEALAERMRERLFAALDERDAMAIPLVTDVGGQLALRDPAGPGPGAFPAKFIAAPPGAKR